MLFRDRADAGRQLARALDRYRGCACVVLALPRGGVPVAAEIAAHLDAPLDVILVRKIGAPAEPELAMGAIVDGGAPVVVRNEDIIRACGVTAAAFEAASRRELHEIERRRKLYIGGRAMPDLHGRTVIVVDDGIATGATIRAALQATRTRGPQKLVAAVPVASPEAVAELKPEADAIVCLETPSNLGAIGFYYRDFTQVADAEVVKILQQFATPGTAPMSDDFHDASQRS